jgi:hypothetical protein
MKSLSNFFNKNNQKKRLLSIILKKFVDERKPIDFIRFKLDYENDEPVILELIDEKFCYEYDNKLNLSLKGFLYCDSEESRKIRSDVDKVIPVLQKIFKENPNSDQLTEDIASKAELSVQDTSMAIHFINFLLDVVGGGSLRDGIFYDQFKLKEGIRKFKTFDEGVEVLAKWRKSHKVSRAYRWLPWVKAHVFQIIMALIALATLINTTYSTYFKKP